MAKQTDPLVLWRQIQQAGGMQPYIDAQLRERGFLVERGDTDDMSDRELAAYKKSLKAEAAERAKIRKESWTAYKANHVVWLGDGIFWNDDKKQDDRDLPNAEERAAENELPPLDSPQQLADALGITMPQLVGMAYHRDAARKLHYVRFTIPKKGGGERAIWAPLPRLKKAQRWILRNIVEKLLVHGAAHGFLPGRSTLSNALVHGDSRVVVRMDLKDFFPTVTWKRVKGIFRAAGYRDRISTLLALICTEAPRGVVELEGLRYFVSLGDRCLPQGAPTSPGLTNTLCLRLDRRLSGWAAKRGWRYTRYADDLTFSLPNAHIGDEPPIKQLIGVVHGVTKAEGFTVHPDKTRIVRRGGRQKVTGLVINGGVAPRVPRTLKRQIRSAIHKLKVGKPLQEGETRETLRGYAAYIYMTDPILGRKLLAEIGEGA